MLQNATFLLLSSQVVIFSVIAAVVGIVVGAIGGYFVFKTVREKKIGSTKKVIADMISKTEEECNVLPKIQGEILRTSSQYVKSGGRLVYSTCTLFKNENDYVVSDFLNSNTDFKLVSVYNQNNGSTCTLMPPEDLGDGFFVAVMERM